MSAAEGADFCAARGDQDHVRHPDEEAGADDAGYGSEVAFEARRISNLTHPAVEHEVAVVGDELASIVVGADARLQPQTRPCCSTQRVAVRAASRRAVPWSETVEATSLTGWG